EFTQNQIVLEDVAGPVIVEKNRAGVPEVGGVDGVVGDRASRGIADFHGYALAGHDEVVADDSAVHIHIRAGRVAEGDGAIATDEQVPLDGDVLASFPQEDACPAAPVHAPDVPELVAVDVPSL